MDYRALQVSISTLKTMLSSPASLTFSQFNWHRNHKPLLTKCALQDIQRTTHTALRLKTLNSAENSWKLLLTWSCFLSKLYPKAKSDLLQGSLESRFVPEDKCGAQDDPQAQQAGVGGWGGTGKNKKRPSFEWELKRNHEMKQWRNIWIVRWETRWQRLVKNAKTWR